MELSSTDIEIVARLGIAIVLGGLIGFERELHGKVAGFRTHSLVSLGSALIMLVSVHIFDVYGSQVGVDPGRIAAQVVTGIGFIGAGTIIRSGTGIKGLTTAAGLWTASGIGLACGVGYFRAAFIATIITLLVLVAFSWIGRKLGARDV
ncbi:MAG: MgtC/SapB family protein [Candidatus Omnitrophica bacterium]|nr:MgtC/SapB family protein [Candidatus Omnitrophota bacterium]